MQITQGSIIKIINQVYFCKKTTTFCEDKCIFIYSVVNVRLYREFSR